MRKIVASIEAPFHICIDVPNGLVGRDGQETFFDSILILPDKSPEWAPQHLSVMFRLPSWQFRIRKTLNACSKTFELAPF